MNDPFDLNRFVEAQKSAYAQALAELRRGQKETHWMWFIFPQFEGLGTSPTARLYAIKSAAEAIAYLRHPLLSQRLEECCRALLQQRSKSAQEILGFPDCLKLRSSMTLFAKVAEPGALFGGVLEKFFDGLPDERTLELLAG